MIGDCGFPNFGFKLSNWKEAIMKKLNLSREGNEEKNLDIIISNLRKYLGYICANGDEKSMFIGTKFNHLEMHIREVSLMFSRALRSGRVNLQVLEDKKKFILRLVNEITGCLVSDASSTTWSVERRRHISSVICVLEMLKNEVSRMVAVLMLGKSAPPVERENSESQGAFSYSDPPVLTGREYGELSRSHGSINYLDTRHDGPFQPSQNRLKCVQKSAGYGDRSEERRAQLNEAERAMYKALFRNNYSTPFSFSENTLISPVRAKTLVVRRVETRDAGCQSDEAMSYCPWDVSEQIFSQYGQELEEDWDFGDEWDYTVDDEGRWSTVGEVESGLSERKPNGSQSDLFKELSENAERESRRRARGRQGGTNGESESEDFASCRSRPGRAGEGLLSEMSSLCSLPPAPPPAARRCPSPSHASPGQAYSSLISDSIFSSLYLEGRLPSPARHSSPL